MPKEFIKFSLCYNALHHGTFKYNFFFWWFTDGFSSYPLNCFIKILIFPALKLIWPFKPNIFFWGEKRRGNGEKSVRAFSNFIFNCVTWQNKLFPQLTSPAKLFEMFVSLLECKNKAINKSRIVYVCLLLI